MARLRSDFAGIETPPDPTMIACSASCEVVVPDTVFRAEFLHSLGRQQPVASRRAEPSEARFEPCYLPGSLIPTWLAAKDSTSARSAICLSVGL